MGGRWHIQTFACLGAGGEARSLHQFRCFDVWGTGMNPLRTAVRLAIASFAFTLAAVWSSASLGADAGRIKVSKGTVSIERDGRKLPAPIGAPIQPQDTVVTGADGTVGITFQDNSM